MRLELARELGDAELLGADTGAVRQRAIAAERGDLRALTAWLADAYAPSADYALAGAGNQASR